jgi:formate dehydrogenase major subunit
MLFAKEMPLFDLGIQKTRSVCGYCGVGCSLDILSKNNRIVGIQPAMDGPANQGALCVKGQFAFDYVHHPDRLKRPLVRRADGKLHETTWDEALAVAAVGFQRVVEQYGRQAIYGIASGRTPTEADYLMQKFVRAGFGTHNIDNCSRA